MLSGAMRKNLTAGVDFRTSHTAPSRQNHTTQHLMKHLIKNVSVADSDYNAMLLRRSLRLT